MSPAPRALLAALIAGLALGLAPAATPAGPSKITCTLAPGENALPAGTSHGLAHHLRQYPVLSLATPAQRTAAEHLRRLTVEASARWRNPRAARRAGYDTHLAKRTAKSPPVGYLHAESRHFSADRHYFDPKRPEALIYANEPGRPLVLIGIMFSMPRGKPGPTPAGPIERWHSHEICVVGKKRGLGQPAGGSCPTGSRLAQGSEMLHLWFTHDLRSAFAVHAPVPELCRDALLTPAACRSGAARAGM